MRFMLRILTASVLIGGSASGLTACNIPAIGDIWIITDGGDLFDKAFNQQVLEGAQEFTNTFNEHRAAISELQGFGNWKNNKMKTRWIISSDSNVSTLQNNYNIATFAKAKVIILAGFNHLEALTPAVQKHYQKLGVRFILIDGKKDKPINVASLTYSAEQSGFLAGLAGAIWLVANHEEYKNGLKMSAFGGVPADTTVSYMMGYYWGVYYFNQYRAINDELLTMTNMLRKASGLENITNDDFINNYKIIFDKVPVQFTRSFESGKNEARIVTGNLINRNKNAIVMPVAGGQTIDLIATIQNSQNNNKAKIIGVDVDQSVQYKYAAQKFITSALKGIHKSVNDWLWHAFNLNANSLPPSIDENGGDYFNGKIPQLPLAGKDYTGITKSNDISAIYDTLMNDSKQIYWLLSQKVSDAFQKLVQDLSTNHNSDKWETAWSDDVNEDNDTYKPKFK